jgi:hypothetical protein
MGDEKERLVDKKEKQTAAVVEKMRKENQETDTAMTGLGQCQVKQQGPYCNYGNYGTLLEVQSLWPATILCFTSLAWTWVQANDQRA